MNKFRASKDLPLVSDPYSGASDNTALYEDRNCVTLSEIFKNIKTYDRNDYKRSIEVKEFDAHLGTEDAIFIIVVAPHCFVALYLAEEYKLYLADGGNNYMVSQKRNFVKFLISVHILVFLVVLILYAILALRKVY